MIGNDLVAGIFYGVATALSYSIFLVVIKLLGQYETMANQAPFPSRLG